MGLQGTVPWEEAHKTWERDVILLCHMEEV